MIDKTRMNELADSILGDWESNEKPKDIAQLELVYNNLSDNHTRKGDLKKYISYFNELEDSGISMDEFYNLDKLLKAEKLIPDDLKQKIDKVFDKTSGKVVNILPNK